MRHDGKGHQEGPVGFGIDNGGLAIGVRLPKRNPVIADEVLSFAGIVDKDVNGAKFVHCFLDGPLAIGAAGDIRDHQQRTACAGDVVDLVCDCLNLVGRFCRGYGNACRTREGKTQRHCPAQSAAPPPVTIMTLSSNSALISGIPRVLMASFQS